MYDMILTGAEEQISAAIARASRAIDVLNEIARARTIRATSTWIVSMNRGQGPAAAFKNAMLAVIHDEFPNRVGQRMTREETVGVTAPPYINSLSPEASHLAIFLSVGNRTSPRRRERWPFLHSPLTRRKSHRDVDAPRDNHLPCHHNLRYRP
jgi:hypothetical protein